MFIATRGCNLCTNSSLIKSTNDAFVTILHIYIITSLQDPAAIFHNHILLGILQQLLMSPHTITNLNSTTYVVQVVIRFPHCS